jgi:hypothetical protein
MDVFGIAEQNADQLDNRFMRLVQAVSAPTKDRLKKFVDSVARDGRIGVNMRPWVVVDLIQNDRHLNMYEAANEAADISGKDCDGILRARLGKWYARRLAFAARFQDGQRFRYGALNIGELGATNYGTFCTVLVQNFPADRRVAYVKTDSLRGYTDSAGNVDDATLRNDVAGQDRCHVLAALKHATQIESREDDKWPNMLCSNDDYIEVLFVADICCKSVEEVRVSSRELAIAEELCFDAHGRKLTEEEKSLASIYLNIFRARRDGLIQLREVADD